jgi:outer membrane protein W
MKQKTLVFTAFIALFMGIVPSLSQAQFTKGNLLVEGNFGNISFRSNKNENTTSGVTTKNDGTSFTIGLYPRVGIFLSDKAVLGTTVAIGGGGSKGDYFNNAGKKTSDYKSSYFYAQLIPFLRYYFGPATSKVRFYGQAGVGVYTDLSNKYDTKNYNTTTGAVSSTFKYNYPKQYFSLSAEALVGLNYFLAENVALNTGIGYSYVNNTQTSNYTSVSGGTTTTSPDTKYKNTSGVINWNLGLTMIIPKRKK